MKVSGRVYIVGAGPGDPDLVTLKGLHALQLADVVLHDRLVHPTLLIRARVDARVIDVGKRVGQENAQQAEIHRLMIEHAQAGRIVCRLQGGDPFVFGRGAEEIEALEAAGVPYEIVPGVSSLTAAPVSARIALTHREFAHGFLAMTGSRSMDFRAPEWEAARSLLKAGGTVVVMMGLARLNDIVFHLLESGCARDLPVAVVSRATWADEQVRFASLASIMGEAAGLTSPSLLIFGKVAGRKSPT